MNKQFFVEVVNLTVGKMYSLPTLYTDRTEACICGQNYVRDRQQENHDDVFYRVLLAKDGKVAEPSYFTVVNGKDEDEDDEACPHPEQECCEDCPFYSECWGFDDEDEEEKDEDFDWDNPACQSSRKTNTNGEDFALQMVMGLIDYICKHCPEKLEKPEAPEEPSANSLAEILSVFNSMTLNP